MTGQSEREPAKVRGRAAAPTDRAAGARVFAIPGDLSAPTGGYAYARHILRALPELIHLRLPGGFPFPSAAELRDTAEQFAAQPAETVWLVDGLALGALPGWCLDSIPGRIVALVHHPLCLETGLSTQAADALRLLERQALARCARVIATSRTTAALLSAEFDVPAQRLTVAEPGTEPAARARCTGSPPNLLAVGSVVPRKGYDILVTALAGLSHLPWTLTIAGALDRDPATVARIRLAIAEYGLTARVTLAGAVPTEDLNRLYAAADLFVSASVYEGYGMAVTEAMARGLPLVAAAGGALADTIPAGAALTCRPGDAAALREALRRMLTDPVLRTACACTSWSAGQRLPRWPHTAGRIAAVLADVARLSD